MSAKYEELIEAGAPRLPEGYYYKIRRSNLLGAPILRVGLHKERAWWFDKDLDTGSLYASEIKDIKDLAWLCQRAYGFAFPEPAPHDWHADFLGRHP